MRIPAALRVSLGLVFLAQFASAETPASADSRETGAAPEPTPAASASPATAPASAAAAAPASSAGPAEPTLDVVPAEPDQPLLEPIPNARDTLGGHFVLGASLGVKWPFGSLDDGVKQRSALGAALAVNLDVGYGISRNVVLGAWGEFDAHSSPSSCGACSGKSFAGGPFIRYHIVQGTRFDPWGALAVGVRSTSVETGSGKDSYFGADLLKLSLGGDWYPTSKIGFGPYVTFDLGTYNSTLHSGLGTGLRVVLDLPGK